jgi:hypothetical protein
MTLCSRPRHLLLYLLSSQDGCSGTCHVPASGASLLQVSGADLPCSVYALLPWQAHQKAAISRQREGSAAASSSARTADIGVAGSIVVAGLAGAINAAITNPLWLITTQMQVCGVMQGNNVGKAALWLVHLAQDLLFWFWVPVACCGLLDCLLHRATLATAILMYAARGLSPSSRRSGGKEAWQGCGR